MALEEVKKLVDNLLYQKEEISKLSSVIEKERSKYLKTRETIEEMCIKACGGKHDYEKVEKNAACKCCGKKHMLTIFDILNNTRIVIPSIEVQDTTEKKKIAIQAKEAEEDFQQKIVGLTKGLKERQKEKKENIEEIEKIQKEIQRALYDS